MPLSDKAKLIQRLTKAAKDEAKSPAARIASARQLLRDTDFSQRSVRVAKHLGKLFMNDETQTPDVRKKASNLFQFCLDERETDQETKGAEIDPTALENLDLNMCISDALIRRNKDVRATPMPAKYIYFPRNDREYLILNFAGLFAFFGYSTAASIDESFFDDPYNDLPDTGNRLQRSINPLFLKGYVEWKQAKFGDTIPDRTSSYFLRFCTNEQVRRWNKLGTLFVPAELAVGPELRRRQLQAHDVERWETPYLWALWHAIMLKRTGKYFLFSADTPREFMAEFPGIEKKPILQEEPQQPTNTPRRVESARAELPRAVSLVRSEAVVPKADPLALIRPAGAPKEICSYCAGAPPESVPPHSCLNYLVPVTSAEFAALQTPPVVAADNSQAERIKKRIREIGYGDAISADGKTVEFDCKQITFQQWENENPE
jgi:hypothetical protein